MNDQPHNVHVPIQQKTRLHFCVSVRNAQPSRDQHNQAPSDKWLALREHLLDRLQGHLLLRVRFFFTPGIETSGTITPSVCSAGLTDDGRGDGAGELCVVSFESDADAALEPGLLATDASSAIASNPVAATTSVSALLSHNATAGTNSSKSASVKNLQHISLRHGASGLNAKASM